jgi:hypothetical protein
MNWSNYLTKLPVVKTASLAVGVLFIANGKIYEVTEVQGDTYRKARQWRRDESTEVALVSDSTLARQLPVIEQGHLLPPTKSRNDLLQNGRYIIFIFPTEQNAIDCAYLDVALCGPNSGLFVRRVQHNPAVEATNGAAVFRRYYYSRTTQGLSTNLADIKPRLGDPITTHKEGPFYWRFLPNWDEGPYDNTKTLSMRPVSFSQEDYSTDDDTLVNFKTHLDETRTDGEAHQS